jgi:hypothetical protein
VERILKKRAEGILGGVNFVQLGKVKMKTDRKIFWVLFLTLKENSILELEREGSSLFPLC